MSTVDAISTVGEGFVFGGGGCGRRDLLPSCVSGLHDLRVEHHVCVGVIDAGKIGATGGAQGRVETAVQSDGQISF